MPEFLADRLVAAQPREQRDLHDVDRVHVRVADVDGAPQDRIVLQELARLEDVDHAPARQVQPHPEILAQGLQSVGHQHAVVGGGDGGVRFRQRHLGQPQRGVQERPAPRHVAQQRALAAIERRRERFTRAQPRRQEQPRLCPREHPRNRAEGFHAVVPTAARRAAADRRQPDLPCRRAGLEVFDEPRVVIHDAAIGAVRGGRETLHRLAPRRRHGRGSRQRRVQYRRRVHLQGADRDVMQPELRLDHFPLHGHAQASVHRSRGLRLDGKMRRPAAAPDAAAAAMEERQRHPGVARRRDDRLLRLVDLPVRRQSSAVLRGVGVAEHYFSGGLRPAGPPDTLARGDPQIPAPLAWLTRGARSRLRDVGSCV